MKKQSLIVKIADESWEMHEICRLNHQTFSEEFPQHEKTDTGLLIDKFHSENQYIICLDGSAVVGMLALRAVRPFSLDLKLKNLDDYLPSYKSFCEIRLLTVKPEYRNSKVTYLLFEEVFHQFVKKQYDCALISGILSQQRLYKRMGFVPFGPIVGEKVMFQPMYSTPELFFKSNHNTIALQHQKRINALPGPVNIKNIVAEEYRNIPESHRSEHFQKKYQEICKTLCDIVHAGHVQIFTGSGTLANEVMLAHLAALSKKGLIMSNGEFGNRIIHQAHCQKLIFEEYKVEFGDELNIPEIENILEKNNNIQWLFFVHCETSTGVLNDLTELVSLCNKRNIMAVVDCVSTFGIVPFDLSKVYMASASSGKAIGSFSGLSMVFFKELLQVPENSVPVYLDICHYIKKDGIPFTLNSNAINALGVAAEIADVNLKYNQIKEKTAWLRKEILQLYADAQPIESKELHPAIITLKLPMAISSSALGKLLEEHNILIHYNSAYLRKQNMIQICLFSDISEEDMSYFVNILKSIMIQKKVGVM